MTKRKLRWLATSLFLLLAGGCGDDRLPLPDAAAPSPDAGVVADAGLAPDASVAPDAGGPPPDAGPQAYQDCPQPPDGGAPKQSIVVMNPQNGVIGKSIDLSCFAENADGLPRPYLMARAGGKIYVALQDFDSFFSNHKNGKLIVIDPAVDRVVRRIDLANKINISDLHLGVDGRLHVAAQGVLGLDFPGFVVEPELTGGIDIIDPSTDSIVGSIDDDVFGGNVTRLATASATRGFAVVAVFDTQGMPRENRYHIKEWNPQSATGSSASVYQSPGAFVSGIEYDPPTDAVYLAEADFSSPRVVALRNSDLQVDVNRTTALDLPPQGMQFLPAVLGRRLIVVEPDFSGGIGLVQTIDLSGSPPFTAVTAPDPVSSDPVVRVTLTEGGVPLVFAVNRFGADNIQWLDPAAGFATHSVSTTKAQWSTGNGSNPQDVIAISETKVYVTLQN